MKILAVVFICWFSSPAAAAPVYNPESDIKILVAAEATATQSGNQLRSAPVEKKRAGELHNLIDQFTQDADAVAGAAQSLYGGTDLPYDEMAAALKGNRKIESVQRRQEEAAASLTGVRARWRQAMDKVPPLNDSLKQNSNNQDQEFKRKEALLKNISDQLSEIDRLLKESEERLRESDEARQIVKDSAGHGAAPRDELGKAADSLSATAAAIRAASVAAKDSVDVLGSEPENETRSRAYQKIAAVLDGAKDIHYLSDVAKNRAENFGGLYKKFFKANALFGENHKAAAGLLSDAGRQLAAVERALESLPSDR